MKSGRWEENFSNELGISLEKLPDIFACHEVVGEVTKNAAKAMGLVPGIPVVAGGLDAACGALGAGAIKVGQTQEQGGQASYCIFGTDLAAGHHNEKFDVNEDSMMPAVQTLYTSAELLTNKSS